MNLASAAASTGAVTLLLVVVAIGAAYLIPGIVASSRHVPNAGSVWIINILLGWTLVGWSVALAMACSAKYQAVMTQYGNGQAPPPPIPGPGFHPPQQPYGYPPQPEPASEWREQLGSRPEWENGRADMSAIIVSRPDRYFDIYKRD